MSKDGINSGYQPSYYADTANPKPEYPVLAEKMTADICIVGAGFTGLSAALHLAEQGYKVVVLEAERIGWGASGRNGGQVCQGHNMAHQELVSKIGREGADQLWQMSLESVALVKDLIAKHRIDCDLKKGVLHVAAKPSHNVHIKETVEYKNSVLNYDALKYVEPEEVSVMLGCERFGAGEYWTEGAHLHPLNYALGLADAAAKAGVIFF